MPQDPEWSWSFFVYGSLTVVGIALVVAFTHGGFFVETRSTFDYVISGALVLGGAALAIRSIQDRGQLGALFGVVLVVLGLMGLLGAGDCHVDCGSAD